MTKITDNKKAKMKIDFKSKEGENNKNMTVEESSGNFNNAKTINNIVNNYNKILIIPEIIEKPNIKIMSLLSETTKEVIALLGIYENISKYNRLLTTKINLLPIMRQIAKLLNISYVSSITNAKEIIEEEINKAKKYIEDCDNEKVKKKW